MSDVNPNEQKPAYSVDYLNQIAVKPASKFRLSQLQMIILGSVGLVIVLGLFIAIINSINSPNKSLERLVVRLQTAEKIVGDSQDNLKDTDLRSQNSSLKIYLTTANSAIKPFLSAERITAGKLDSAIVKQESGENMTARLEEARLNAVFDRTYARELAYELDITINLIRTIYNSSSRAKLKEFLDATLNNLIPIQRAFEEFQGTNS